MSHRCNHPVTRTICLTEEEAIALLEICLHTKAEDDLLKVRVMDKVGDLCREFIKAGGQGSVIATTQADRSPVRDALDALMHRRAIVENACA